MLQGFVVGTLAAIHTAMLPLSGVGHGPTRVYRLETPACGDRPAGAIHVAAGDASLQVILQTEACASGRHGASVALSLPVDLLDDDYLERLPTNASFVVMNVPSLKNLLAKVRVKLTKEKAQSGATFIVLEWLPAAAGEAPEHSPVKIWLKDRNAVTGDGELGWSKIEVADLGPDISFAVNGEIRAMDPLPHRPTAARRVR